MYLFLFSDALRTHTHSHARSPSNRCHANETLFFFMPRSSAVHITAQYPHKKHLTSLLMRKFTPSFIHTQKMRFERFKFKEPQKKRNTTTTTTTATKQQKVSAKRVNRVMMIISIIFASHSPHPFALLADLTKRKHKYGT